MSIRFTRQTRSPTPSSSASSLRATEARRRAVQDATAPDRGRASSPRAAGRHLVAALGLGVLNVVGGLVSIRDRLVAQLRALQRNLRAASDALRARRVGTPTRPIVRPGRGARPGKAHDE